MGVDQKSGLAALRIADDLPAARFDMGDPATNSVAVAMALKPPRHSTESPAATVYAGTVVSAGRAINSDQGGEIFSTAVVDAPLSGGDIGCPLLDDAGQVSGILERTKQSDGATTAMFLPAELVLGVTQQLVTSGGVDHGWLGIGTSDAGTTDPTAVHTATTAALATTPGDGARLDTVDQTSPAAAVGLQAGDVITGIDGYPVQSKAELETRLYADSPGTTVYLAWVRGETPMTAPVVLADPDTDVPGTGSSS